MKFFFISEANSKILKKRNPNDIFLQSKKQKLSSMAF